MKQTDEKKMTEKKKRILEAAVIIFERQGYSATSTKEIAKMAGVAEGTIFRHFGTKKGLMLQVTQQTIERLGLPTINEGLSEILERDYDSVEEFIKALFQNRYGLIKERLPVFKLLIQELPFQPEIRGMLRSNLSELPFTRATSRLKEKGKMVDLPDEDLMRMILTSIIGYFSSHYILFPEFYEGDPDEELEKFIQFISKGLSK